MQTDDKYDFFSDRVKAVPPSAIRKFFDLANEMKGEVISLSIGEPDFVTPWSVREAGIFSLEQGHTNYSPNPGFIELRDAIAVYLKRRFDLSYVPASEVLVTVGGSEAIDLLARALLNPGDEVVIVEPCFVAYKAAVLLAGGVPVCVKTTEENSYKVRPEDIEAAITPKTKLVMIGYPNNPTGAILTAEEMKGIVSVLEQHPRVAMMSDELYAELYYGEDSFTSFGAFPSIRDRLVVVNGFSKTYAMTGWRIGYACGPADMIAMMNKIHQYCIMCSPTTAQFAAIEAALYGDAAVTEMRDEYNRRRRVVVDGVRKAGLSCFEPLGAFYAFPSISGLGVSSEDFCQRFLMEEKVAIVPGRAFGECGEGAVRISYAAAMEDIQEALCRMKSFVEKLKSGK